MRYRCAPAGLILAVSKSLQVRITHTREFCAPMRAGRIDKLSRIDSAGATRRGEWHRIYVSGASGGLSSALHKEELWEASLTPILRCIATCFDVEPVSGSETPPTNRFCVKPVVEDDQNVLCAWRITPHLGRFLSPPRGEIPSISPHRQMSTGNQQTTCNERARRNSPNFAPPKKEKYTWGENRKPGPQPLASRSLLLAPNA